MHKYSYVVDDVIKFRILRKFSTSERKLYEVYRASLKVTIYPCIKNYAYITPFDHRIFFIFANLLNKISIFLRCTNASRFLNYDMVEAVGICIRRAKNFSEAAKYESSVVNFEYCFQNPELQQKYNSRSSVQSRHERKERGCIIQITSLHHNPSPFTYRGVIIRIPTRDFEENIL